eukprot:TRINITY_DN7550_c0_g1_i1.p1 TRINITY_DN7550_c0_g1~~TRINITY_DN7550_c0_g1_i1.p1  ORF type:complete len:137 (-),score=20.75 TRINITY_DN7550_c0_g1_i1:68-478(-)
MSQLNAPKRVGSSVQTDTAQESLSTISTQTLRFPPPANFQPSIDPYPQPLRGVKKKPQDSSNRIKWTDDTVDNEHLNKKKSKRCCIFHKQRAFGESDTESSGSDESDSESGPKPSKAPQKHHKDCPHHSHHEHPHE